PPGSVARWTGAPDWVGIGLAGLARPIPHPPPPRKRRRRGPVPTGPRLKRQDVDSFFYGVCFIVRGLDRGPGAGMWWRVRARPRCAAQLLLGVALRSGRRS